MNDAVDGRAVESSEMKASVFISKCPRCGSPVTGKDFSESGLARAVCWQCGADLEIRQDKETGTFEVKESKPS